MTDVRHDLVSGRVVIVAADRATRPHTLVQPVPTRIAAPSAARSAPGTSPMTPPEILRTGERRRR